MDLILVQLGKRIRYLRKKRKLSQEELAFRAEIHKNYLSGLETGNRNASILVLQRIAVALEINLAILLHGIEALPIGK